MAYSLCLIPTLPNNVILLCHTSALESLDFLLEMYTVGEPGDAGRMLQPFQVSLVSVKLQ